MEDKNIFYIETIPKGTHEWAPVCCVMDPSLPRGGFIRVFFQGPPMSIVQLRLPNGKLLMGTQLVFGSGKIEARTYYTGIYTVSMGLPSGKKIYNQISVGTKYIETVPLTITTEPSDAECGVMYPRRWYKTPVTLPMAPASWAIWIKKEGYLPDLFGVNMLSGSKKVHRVLKPADKNNGIYYLLITCPHGAKVYVNEEYKGETPLVVRPSSSSDRIKLTKQGYHDWTFDANLPSQLLILSLPPADVKPCDLRTFDECAEGGCYWYDGSCHSLPPGGAPPAPPIPGPGPPRSVPQRQEKWHPIPPGVSIGNAKVAGWGTLGCVVMKDNKKMMLTNSHVLGLFGTGKVGDNVFQSTQSNIVGKVSAIIPLVPEPGINETDCALAEPLKQEDLIPKIPIPDDKYEPSYIPSGVATVVPKALVKKSGARTGYSEGIVTAIGATISLEVSGKKYKYKNVIIATKMGDKGDSGSLVCEVGTDKAFGLLFSGNISKTNFLPISPTLNKLGCSLYTEGMAPPYVPPTKAQVTFTSNPTGANISLKKK